MPAKGFVNLNGQGWRLVPLNDRVDNSHLLVLRLAESLILRPDQVYQRLKSDAHKMCEDLLQIS